MSQAGIRMVDGPVEQRQPSERQGEGRGVVRGLAPSQSRSRARTQSKWWFLAGLPLGALLLAVAVSTVIRKGARGRVDLRSERLGAASGADSEGGELGKGRVSTAADRLAETLLADSILSIVQNYYVDPERVDNGGLLDVVISALAAHPRVDAGRGDGLVWVEIDGERASFPVKDPPSYQDVLDAFSGIANLCSEAGIALAQGEAPEKNAPREVSLLNSMLAELDAHSALLSPDAYRELRQGTEGSFGGLGVLVGIRDNQLTVIKPLPRSPAQRAGIKKKDRILGIDGLFTYGYSLDELVEYMRGDPGTEVNLSLLRDGAQSPSQMILKREIIHVDSVSAEEIPHPKLKILKLTIENFASRTSREVLGAIKKYRAKTGGVLNGLVLDLRSNPGGLLDQAVQVADLFLQEGVIVTTRGRREEMESAGTGFDEVGFPMTVLIDGDSASASEIVAGALQDHGRAVVIGQPSFGKGSVQTIFELPGERALKLTIARYYTPDGRSIQNVGIVPDVWLQPVSRGTTNENLFGSYRYKNERFLRNHLEARGQTSPQEPESSASPSAGPRSGDPRPPALKAYYLSAADVEAAPDADASERTGPDRELELALKMFEKLHHVYGDRMPAGTGRASHWLGLAGPELAAAGTRLDREASGWLTTNHHLAWAGDVHPEPTPHLDLKLDAKNVQEVASGTPLTVHWSLENPGAAAAHRVSVFIRSDATGFETKEVLVGDIPARETARGAVTLTVPGWWEEGPLLLRVGAAADAWPVPGAAADYLIQVRSRPMADLTASLDLVDETGSVPGTLEAREHAALLVKLSNHGVAAANNLSVKIVSLAGVQVVVPDAGQALSRIPQGQTVEFKVPVDGARTVWNPELAFGVSVECKDLRVPLRKRFTVKAHPNADLSRRDAVPAGLGAKDAGAVSH
jgi:carboxyl-terminal processing protease